MTNSITRASRLFRDCKATSFRLGLRKSRKVRSLVVIVNVQLDRYTVRVSGSRISVKFDSTAGGFSTSPILATYN